MISPPTRSLPPHGQFVSMKFTSFLTLLALVLAVHSQDVPHIDTPPALQQCAQTQLTFSGGQPPYNIDALPQGQTSGPLAEIGSNVEGLKFNWTVNIQQNTGISLRIQDANGGIGFSRAITVQVSNDSSCFDGRNSSLSPISTATSSSDPITNSQKASPTPGGESKKTSVRTPSKIGAIVGGIVGVAIFVGAAIFLIAFIRKRQRKRFMIFGQNLEVRRHQATNLEPYIIAIREGTQGNIGRVRNSYRKRHSKFSRSMEYLMPTTELRSTNSVSNGNLLTSRERREMDAGPFSMGSNIAEAEERTLPPNYADVFRNVSGSSMNFASGRMA